MKGERERVANKCKSTCRVVDKISCGPCEMQLVFERKIIQRIYGLVHVNGTWKIRSNKEINELL